MKEIQRTDLRSATPPDAMPTRTETIDAAPAQSQEPTTVFPMADETKPTPTTKDKVTTIVGAIGAIAVLLATFGINVPSWLMDKTLLTTIGVTLAGVIGTLGYFVGKPARAK